MLTFLLPLRKEPWPVSLRPAGEVREGAIYIYEEQGPPDPNIRVSGSLVSQAIGARYKVVTNALIRFVNEGAYGRRRESSRL